MRDRCFPFGSTQGSARGSWSGGECFLRIGSRVPGAALLGVEKAERTLGDGLGKGRCLALEGTGNHRRNLVSADADVLQQVIRQGLETMVKGMAPVPADERLDHPFQGAGEDLAAAPAGTGNQRRNLVSADADVLQQVIRQGLETMVKGISLVPADERLDQPFQSGGEELAAQLAGPACGGLDGLLVDGGAGRITVGSHGVSPVLSSVPCVPISAPLYNLVPRIL